MDQDQDQRLPHRGAGGVVLTRLATTGYRLPARYALTTDEERKLYDLEIHVRLGQDDCVCLLSDALADFPPDVFLRRPGLLEAVLDVVGGTNIAVADDGDGAAARGALAPAAACRWCAGLLGALLQTYQSLLDGALVCMLPPTYDKISQLAESMLALRYPALASGAAELAAGDASISVTGFAFACCAASTPLLARSNCPATLLAVAALQRTALALIPEPCNGETKAVGADVMRFQHLVTALEQTLFYFGEVPDVVGLYGRAARTPRSAYELCVVDVFVHTYCALPATCFARDTAAHTPCIDVGAFSLELLKRLCLVDSPQADKLRAILAALEPAAAESIVAVKDMCVSALRFVGLYRSYSAGRLSEMLELGPAAVTLVELGVASDSGDDWWGSLSAEVVEAVVSLLIVVPPQDERSLAAVRSLLLRVLSAPCSECLQLTLDLCLGFLGDEACRDAMALAFSQPRALVMIVLAGSSSPSASPLVATVAAFLDCVAAALIEADALELSSSRGQDWAELLLPIRTFELVLLNREGSALPRSVVYMVTQIEMACIHSPDAAAALHRSLLLRMFALRADVRTASYSKLCVVLGLDELGVDPFPANASVRLKEEREDSLAPTVSTKNSAEPDHSRYSDLQKLASVAFGSYETHIKSIALRQLRVHLADRGMLRSSPLEWLSYVAGCCFQNLQSLDVMSEPSSADEDLLLESAVVFSILVSQDARIRNQISFLSGDFNILSLLKGAMLWLQRPPSSAGRRTSRADLVYLCVVRILQAWTCCGGDWVTRSANDGLETEMDASAFPSALFSVCGLAGLAPGHDAFFDPSVEHLINYRVAGQALRPHNCQVDLSLSEQMVYVLRTLCPSDHVCLQSSSRVDFHGALMANIASSKGHKQLRSSLDLGRLVSWLRPNESSMFLEGTVGSLSRIFQTAPKNYNDFLTLTSALAFISELIRANSAAAASDPSYLAIVCMGATAVHELFASVLNPAFKIEGLQSPTVKWGIKLAVVCFSQQIAAKYDMLPKSWSLTLSRSQLLQSVVLIICDETAPAHLRAQTAALMATLVRHHGVFPLLESAALHHFQAAQDSSVTCLDAIFRTLSLPRTPDSTDKCSVVVGCLQIFLASEDELLVRWSLKKDFKVLSRLIHDRRTSVRWLACEFALKIFTRFKGRDHIESSTKSADLLAVANTMRHVMADRFDAPMVRLCSVQVALRDSDNLVDCLLCCQSLLDDKVGGWGFSFRCLAGTVDAMSVALDSSPGNAVELLRKLRLLPTLMALLRSEVPEACQDAVVARVCVSGRTHNDTTTHAAFPSAWTATLKLFSAAVLSKAVEFKASVCRLFHKLLVLDNPYVIETFRQVGTVRLVMHNVVLLGQQTPGEPSLAMRRCFCSMMDLLSVSLSSTQSTRECVDSISSLHVVRILLSYLEYAVKELRERPLNLEMASVVETSLRVLWHIIEERESRAGIGMGGGFGDSELSDEAHRLLGVLGSLRISLRRDCHLSPRLVALLYQVDVVFSSFLKHSAMSRSLLMQDGNAELGAKGALLYSAILDCLSTLRNDPEVEPMSQNLKQRNPKCVVKKEVSTSPQSVVDHDDNRWRSRSRGYEVRDKTATTRTTSLTSSLSLAHKSRLRLHGSLLILQHAFSNSPEACDWGYSCGISELLGDILRIASNWASSAKGDEEKKVFCGIKLPTYNQIIIAGIGLLCSCLLDPSDMRALSGWGPRKITSRSSIAPTPAAALSQLLTLGTSTEIDPSVRQACSAVAARLIPALPGGAPKTTVYKSLDDLKTPQFPSASFYFTLNMLFSGIEVGGEFSATQSSRLCASNLLSFRDLLDWLIQKHGQSEEVLCCAVRNIGRMSHSSSKRLRSTASSEDSLNFLEQCLHSAREDVTFASIASTTWCIIHSSEQAVAVLRTMRLIDILVARVNSRGGVVPESSEVCLANIVPTLQAIVEE